ncbi:MULTISPECIES: SDR family NAD(P)-dependent oxidoreductase [unclassified Cyanobium]|uniref:SDR family NAD(P)-dependent oxidoreductase n=1 Tax=unclassified Cyanobium TaxID=2627006 RepID=UPI0020CC1E76|nr:MULTISPECIES: SDR family NAD(P)-dependent oxidoreductase [unclassified Cyanobium]MCP9857499.1 SDR family NAD(P)-dependent oxidoreductase [Cyanobium sp. Cruz-8H5]MCP9864929.1 SDR family NAD(P)-dependent oxidoreductase [Cyanobium sp. Cruz-8D1]
MAQPRILLISGASRGIGRAIAERALADGHRLSLGVRDPAGLPQGPLLEAARLRPDRMLLQAYDAGDPSQASTWVAATLAQFGAIDGLIHCAGLFSRVGLLFEAGQEQEIEALWRVNLMGPWWLTRAAWPALVASGDGRVITLVSMSGQRVKGPLAAYPCSKFALMALCQAMRNEGWDAGIRVTAICPGWVNTAMASQVTTLSAEAMTQPEDLATLTAQLLRLPASAVPFELKINCVLEL